MFTDDCSRIENGMPATGGRDTMAGGAARGNSTSHGTLPGCKAQFQSGVRHFVAGIPQQLAKIFRIENGNIRRIEALFHRCPYGMGSVWCTWAEPMSGQAKW